MCPSCLSYGECCYRIYQENGKIKRQEHCVTEMKRMSEFYMNNPLQLFKDSAGLMSNPRDIELKIKKLEIN
jgi:hypothetical protein